MAAARIDPLTVEALQFIIIMYAFIFSIVEGCIGDGETVLVVTQTDLLATVDHRLDGTSDSRAHQLVVNPQVGKHEGYVTECIDVGRVEHGDTIGAAKDQATVGQLARGAIAELVACQSVGLVE